MHCFIFIFLCTADFYKSVPLVSSDKVPKADLFPRKHYYVEMDMITDPHVTVTHCAISRRISILTHSIASAKRLYKNRPHKNALLATPTILEQRKALELPVYKKTKRPIFVEVGKRMDIMREMALRTEATPTRFNHRPNYKPAEKRRASKQATQPSEKKRTVDTPTTSKADTLPPAVEEMDTDSTLESREMSTDVSDAELEITMVKGPCVKEALDQEIKKEYYDIHRRTHTINIDVDLRDTTGVTLEQGETKNVFQRLDEKRANRFRRFHLGQKLTDLKPTTSAQKVTCNVTSLSHPCYKTGDTRTAKRTPIWGNRPETNKNPPAATPPHPAPTWGQHTQNPLRTPTPQVPAAGPDSPLPQSHLSLSPTPSCQPSNPASPSPSMTSIAASVVAPSRKKRSPWDIMGDVEQTRRPVLATTEGKLALEKYKANEAQHSTPSKPTKLASKLHTKQSDDSLKSNDQLLRECKELIAANKLADHSNSDWDDALESDYEEVASAWKEAKSSREAESQQ